MLTGFTKDLAAARGCPACNAVADEFDRQGGEVERDCRCVAGAVKPLTLEASCQKRRLDGAKLLVGNHTQAPKRMSSVWYQSCLLMGYAKWNLNFKRVFDWSKATIALN